MTQNAQKRCWYCNIDLVGLLHTNRIIAQGIPEFMRKCSMLTVKQLKQRKIFEISLSESRVYKKWQTLAIIQEISDSNLETGRYSPNIWNLPNYP